MTASELQLALTDKKFYSPNGEIVYEFSPGGFLRSNDANPVKYEIIVDNGLLRLKCPADSAMPLGADAPLIKLDQDEYQSTVSLWNEDESEPFITLSTIDPNQMTYEKLKPAIALLNEHFKGKKMLPGNIEVKEFIAGTQYHGKQSNVLLAYSQNNDVEKTAEIFKDDPMMIYAAFINDTTIPITYQLCGLPEFLQMNGIDPKNFAEQANRDKE